MTAAEATETEHELKRLRSELEQARVAAEDAQHEITLMVEDARRNAVECARLRTANRLADEAAAALRRRLGERLAADAEMETAREERNSAEEELRVALEELTVLSEQLEQANQMLLDSNAELEARVVERTAELRAVNESLESRVAAQVLALRDAQNRLHQKQKLEAIGQLTSGVAHDFNNLLMVIGSGISLLDRPLSQPARDSILKNMSESVRRGADLTYRLLAFGRRQALRPLYVETAGQIAGFQEMLAQALRGDIAINNRCEPGIWPIFIDTGALELAILNLAVNARDAMPKGGVIRLSARNVTLSPAAAAALDLTGSDYVAVSVEDTGIGMTKAVVDRAFEPFFSTKESGRGTGLGLAQVYGFARQSGGTAAIESEAGRGTCVTLYLPRAQADAAAAAAPGPTAPAQPTPKPSGDSQQRLSVLLVEDDDQVATAVAALLHQLGHETRRAANAASAKAAITRRPDAYHVVLTDILMPGGASGVDLLKDIKRHWPHLPVVLMTGYNAHAGESLAAAAPLLKKPYDLAALKTVLERLEI
jgi:signal transduction histidine kinase/CheY-like chemotaxis protein